MTVNATRDGSTSPELVAAHGAVGKKAVGPDLRVVADGRARRRQLATELHDDLGQTLALLKIKLSGLTAKTPPMDMRDEDRLGEIKQLIAQANRQVRSLTFQISPPILEQFGLVPAVEWLAEDMGRHYGLRVAVESDKEPVQLAIAYSFCIVSIRA